MQPISSTAAVQPGRMTIVVSRSSMIAGPAMRWPTASECGRRPAPDSPSLQACTCRVRLRLAGRRRQGHRPVERDDRAARGQAPGDDFDRHVRRIDAVERLIGRLEGGAQCGRVVVRARIDVERDGHLVLLAEIAQIGGEDQRHVSSGSRPRPAPPWPRAPARPGAIDPRPVQPWTRHQSAAHEIEPHRRDQRAEGRQHARLRREDHLRAVQQLRDAAGMHRPGAAEGQQRQAAPIDAAIGRMRARRRRHVLADDVEDAARRLGAAHAESSPSLANAASAALRSSFMSPPRKWSASSRPSTRSASVTVGSVPPRP